MRAYELHGVNDLRREDIEKPEIPSGWVLVQVKASGICSSDIPRIFTNGTYHFPTIPGHEFSGVVAAYGEGVPEERVGKRVGIFPLIPCRTCPQCRQKKYEMCEHYDYLGSRRDGGFAEYVAVPDWNLMELPENVTLIRDYDPSLPELLHDPDQIEQVLLNIVRNALQALGPEGGEIILRTRTAFQLTLHGMRYRLAARIDVEDNGPGIPSHLQDTLFYPMVSGREGGTGLGLSIARNLIDQHSGKIEFTSWPGHTEFSVYLPIRK